MTATTRVRSATPWRAPSPRFPALPASALPCEPHGPAPWPLNEQDIDLPDEPPPPARRRAGVGGDPAADPLYLGCLTVTNRVIPGPFTLDLLLAADGSQLEIGPYTLDRDNLRRLDGLLRIVHALLGHDRPPRPCADLEKGGLSEGEPRP